MRLEEIQVGTIADLEAIEKIPIQERLPFFNTYDLIKHGAAIDPDAIAISFLMSGTRICPFDTGYLFRLSGTDHSNGQSVS